MPAPQKDGPRANRDIRGVREVQLIDDTGQNRGVVAFFDALALAEEAGLDLVEIAPNSVPPVCKLLDYGRFRFNEQKKQNEARKKQKTVEVKEIKLRPGIAHIAAHRRISPGALGIAEETQMLLDQLTHRRDRVGIEAQGEQTLASQPCTLDVVVVEGDGAAGFKAPRGRLADVVEKRRDAKRDVGSGIRVPALFERNRLAQHGE